MNNSQKLSLLPDTFNKLHEHCKPEDSRKDGGASDQPEVFANAMSKIFTFPLGLHVLM